MSVEAPKPSPTFSDAYMNLGLFVADATSEGYLEITSPNPERPAARLDCHIFRTFATEVGALPAQVARFVRYTDRWEQAGGAVASIYLDAFGGYFTNARALMLSPPEKEDGPRLALYTDVAIMEHGERRRVDYARLLAATQTPDGTIGKYIDWTFPRNSIYRVDEPDDPDTELVDLHCLRFVDMLRDTIHSALTKEDNLRQSRAMPKIPD